MGKFDSNTGKTVCRLNSFDLLEIDVRYEANVRLFCKADIFAIFPKRMRCCWSRHALGGLIDPELNQFFGRPWDTQRRYLLVAAAGGVKMSSTFLTALPPEISVEPDEDEERGEACRALFVLFTPFWSTPSLAAPLP